MTRNDVKSNLQTGWLQVAMQILTVLGLILASYITLRLAPLQEHLGILDIKVEALEKSDAQVASEIITLRQENKTDHQRIIDRLNTLFEPK